jgi:hypothetical protein
MALVLRRSSPDHHDERERDKFWSVTHKDLYVGSINEKRGRSDEPPYWFWTLIIHAPGMRGTDGTEPTRDAAMLAFRKAFDRRMTEIGDEGWAHHVEHMRLLKARSGPNRY